MNVLAIETSCDETAVAIIEVAPRTEVQPREKISVLANVISSQVKLHAQYGGVVPSLAAREHAENIGHVFEQAMEEAANNQQLKTNNFPIDLIAVTYGPGLSPALLVGLTFARTLAWRWDKPLVGVNHMDGHIHSNWLRPITEASISNDQFSIAFPALNLIVSGGHTELVIMRDHGDYEIIGETQDDAVGEAFDKVARLLGLGYPGGPAVAARAAQSKVESRKLKIEFPRPMLKSGDYNFSYSGLKTAVLYKIQDLKKEGVEMTDEVINEIAYAFQEAAIDVLVAKAKLATLDFRPSTVLLSGGVSANKLLRERLHHLATELGLPFLCPEMKYTTDNAAMIAVAGYFAYQKGQRADWQTLKMDANLRLGHNPEVLCAQSS